jgi:WD40 repeat protein
MINIIWDLTTNASVNSLSGHAGSVRQLKLNMLISTAGMLVSVSNDGTLKFWNLSNNFINVRLLVL